MTQFNEIAEEYKELRTLILREVLDNTLHGILGDIKGKSILDLACGNGFYTRRFKERGASRVVGVDMSEQMLTMAKADEEKESLGIEYILADIQEMGVIDKFDYVTGSFLLNNAPTEEVMAKMCQAVYNNLKVGGRFVTLNSNNKLPAEEFEDKNYRKYGLVTKIISTIPQQGAMVNVTYHIGPQVLSFDVHWLNIEFYQSALESVKFKNITWHDKLIISAELKQEYGADYWDYLLQNPIYAIIECEK